MSNPKKKVVSTPIPDFQPKPEPKSVSKPKEIKKSKMNMEVFDKNKKLLSSEPLIIAHPRMLTNAQANYIWDKLDEINNPRHVKRKHVRIILYASMSWIPVLEIGCDPKDFIIPVSKEFRWYDERRSAIVYIPNGGTGTPVKIELIRSNP